MRRSDERILTTHVGSLPRPADLLALAQASPRDERAYTARLAEAVRDNVRQQREHGLDIVDDGEFGKPDFVGYINARLGGFERGEVQGGSGFDLRDGKYFPEFYRAMAQANSDMRSILTTMYPPLVCTGPIKYTGQAALKRDIENLRAAAAGSGATEIFMPSISPENAQHGKKNGYYKTDEEFSVALADALNEEYRAIVDAGFLVQVDDPYLITYYNRNPDKSVDECRHWAAGRIEILNHALRGIPEEKIRFHTCYSFDSVPRLGDMELKDMLDLILRIKAGGYSFEGANPRHEHEYKLWEHHKLPEGRVLIPGVIAISTVVVEHPDLVAERIVRYAKLVGRENVIASADCGFGTVAVASEFHPSVAWAKIDALVEGARRATKQLWG
jgi:5-methyltetrahydropteroyltriglutamate--homocysteine methyltransferase